MLTKELRDKLIKMIKEDPKEAIKIIGEDPQLLGILLNSDEKVDNEIREKIKYINMNSQMQNQLEQKSKELKTSQGVLLGVGLLFLLVLLNK